MWDTWNVTYHHTSQPTFKTTHSINIDLMVGLFFLVASLTYQLFNDLPNIYKTKTKTKTKTKKIHDRLIVN